MIDPSHQLWCEVLYLAVQDALHGPKGHARGRKETLDQARAYILEPSPDFEHICHLAGVDPEAVRDRVRQQIDNLEATPQQPKRQQRKPDAKPSGVQPKLYKHDGCELTLRQWAELHGVTASALNHRMKHHSETVGQALAAMLDNKRKRQILAEMEAFDPEIISDEEAARAASEGRGENEHPSLTLTVPLHADFAPVVPCSPRLSDHYPPLSPYVNSTKVDRGVGCDFDASLGTGGGTSAQETPEIEFTEARP